MISSKFFTILATFSPNEMKSFEIWLNSPWCNKNKNLIALLERIKKHHPTFNSLKLTKEKLFFKILPKGKFSDRRMNNILSEGFLAAEKFMVFNRLEADEALKRKLLIKEQNLRKLDEWFVKQSLKAINRLENKPVKDWEDHLALLQYHRQIYRQPDNKFRHIPGGQTIVQMTKELDMFYAQEAAAIINEKIFRNRILRNENHDISSALNSWTLLTKEMDHPSLNLYKIRFQYEENNLLSKFKEYRAAVESTYKQLNEIDQKLHFYSMSNDASFLIKRQLLEVKDLLPLNIFGLESGILIENGLVLTKTFTTLVFSSNHVKNFDWTRSFIKEYWNKISTDDKVGIRDWAYAHTAYNSGDIKGAIDILMKNEYKSDYFQRITRLLTMQCYFDLFLIEKAYYSFLFSYFDSFEKYLTRMSMESKTGAHSFIRTVQLLRTLSKYFIEDDFQKEKVGNLLTNENNIQAAGWLSRRVKKVIALRQGGK